MRAPFDSATLALLERRRELKAITYRRKKRGQWEGHNPRHQRTPTPETFKPDPLHFFQRPEPPTRSPTAPPPRASLLTLPDLVQPRPAGLYAALEAVPQELERQKAKSRRKKATKATKGLKLPIAGANRLALADPPPEPVTHATDDHNDAWLGRFSYSPQANQ